MKKVLISLGAVSLLGAVSHNAQADSIYGGWSDDKGYFTLKTDENPQVMRAYSATNTPQHTGKKESRTVNGTSQFRANGTTIWKGRHYTTARMESYGDVVLTTSGRVYGTDKTNAISPWWKFIPDVDYHARTYYGR